MSGVHVSAERWIRPLPVGRGDDKLDALAKDVLREVWGCVDWSIERAPVGRERPWISRAEIAAAIGASEHAVAKQVRKLTQLGWLRWTGRCWDLAWESPSLQGPAPDRAVPEPCSPSIRTLQSEQPNPTGSAPEPCTVPNQGSQERSQERSQVSAPTSAPDARSPMHGSGSPMQVEQTAQCHPRKPRPDPRPGRAFDPEIIADAREQLASGSLRIVGENPANSTNPRKTRARRKAQPELDLGDAPSEPDAAAELVELHQRLRAEAAALHPELRPEAWPRKGTGKALSIAARVRQALSKHGPEACRRYLEQRSVEWRADPGLIVRYPPDQVWSPKIVDPTIARLGAARAPAVGGPRGSPPPSTRPVVTRPLPRFNEDEPEETRP